MSVTLYSHHFLSGKLRVGTFVERAWCATHNLPIIHRNALICHEGLRMEESSKCVPEPLPRLVQEPPQ